MKPKDNWNGLLFSSDKIKLHHTCSPVIISKLIYLQFPCNKLKHSFCSKFTHFLQEAAKYSHIMEMAYFIKYF